MKSRFNWTFLFLSQKGLLGEVNDCITPTLTLLLEPGESLGDLLTLTPEVILLRWVNYHLTQADTDRRISNFTTDIQVQCCKLLSHYIWALTQIVYILPIRDSWLAHIINYEPNTLRWYILFMDFRYKWDDRLL